MGTVILSILLTRKRRLREENFPVQKAQAGQLGFGHAVLTAMLDWLSRGNRGPRKVGCLSQEQQTEKGEQDPECGKDLQAGGGGGGRPHPPAGLALLLPQVSRGALLPWASGHWQGLAAHTPGGWSRRKCSCSLGSASPPCPRGTVTALPGGQPRDSSRPGPLPRGTQRTREAQSGAGTGWTRVPQLDGGRARTGTQTAQKLRLGQQARAVPPRLISSGASVSSPALGG